MRKIGVYVLFTLCITGLLGGVLFADPDNGSEDEWILTPTTINEVQTNNVEGSTPATVNVHFGGALFSLEGIDVPTSGSGESEVGIPQSLHISLESAGAARLLQALGALANWSGRKDVLCISASGRDVYFNSAASKMKFRKVISTGSRGFMKKDSATYLPMRDLASHLGLVCSDWKAMSGSLSECTIIPSIDEVCVKEEDGRRMLLIHSSAPVRYTVESADDRHVSLLFNEVEWGVKDEDVSAGNAVVSHESSGAAHGMRLNVNYPRYWEGRLLSRMTSGNIPIEFVPDFPLSSGYRAETVESLKGVRQGQTVTVHLSASGPVHYFWSYDKEKNELAVEFPLLTADVPASTAAITGERIKACSFSSLMSGYGASRMALSFAGPTAFQFLPPDESNPYALRIQILPSAALAVNGEGMGCTSKPEVCGTIVIDPGHGGCDPGACNNSMSLREKDITQDICNQLERFLSGMGWKVILTRRSDRDVSWAYSPDKVELQARADVANINQADAFISVHCNAAYSSSHNGSSIHWSKDIDYALAQSFRGVLGKALDLAEKGLFRDNFYVLTHTRMPAVLLETAFISNARDAMKLGDRDFRVTLARSIAKGLDTFMGGRFARKTKRSTVSNSMPSSGEEALSSSGKK
ncbi:MAG: N-acetylmuramoyl-L-alanine amidase [Vulcanimicrobiota bacterium]